MSKRKQEASRNKRLAVTVGGAVQLALFSLAQSDLAKRSAAEVRGPKWVWRLVTLVNFVGPVLYFVRGRRVPVTTPPLTPLS